MTDPKDASNMLIILSGMADHDDLVEMLQNAIDGYKSDPNKETWNRLEMMCTLVVMKTLHTLEGGDENPMEASMKMMKEMREFDDIVKLMKPGEQ